MNIIRSLAGLTRKDVDIALDANDKDIWNKGNRVLYKLCADYPDHTDDQAIVAKVWLIGRSYAAAVERGRVMDMNTQTSEDFYREKVTTALMEAEIDELLQNLKNRQPENAADDADLIRSGLEVHVKLVQALSPITGKSHRSFASKYLHFHVPDAFFIYDSIAAHGLSTLLPRYRVKDELCTKDQVDGIDDIYRTFVNKAHFLRGAIYERFSEKLTPRQLDRLLLRVGNENT